VTRSCDLYRHIEGLVDESEIASDTATCSRGPATRHAEHEQSLGARRRAIAHKHNSKSPSYTRCTKLCIAVCKTRTIDYWNPNTCHRRRIVRTTCWGEPRGCIFFANDHRTSERHVRTWAGPVVRPVVLTRPPAAKEKNKCKNGPSQNRRGDGG
jgi:hypothetical protein